jgi:hypothetical protein
MGTQGTFGYIIGKKKRFMYVQFDADLLWSILTREIYVLMKHYKTPEALKEIFEKIKSTKGEPKETDHIKYAMFTDFDSKNKNTNKNKWSTLLRYCQGSYINIIESNHFINEKEEHGLTFILDFNKGIILFYNKDSKGKKEIHNIAKIEDIMEYEEMPTKSYTEIITEMREDFNTWYESFTKIQKELEKLYKLKQDAHAQGNMNIEEKIDKYLDNAIWEEKKLNMERKVFYKRINALDLIDES